MSQHIFLANLGSARGYGLSSLSGLDSGFFSSSFSAFSKILMKFSSRDRAGFSGSDILFYFNYNVEIPFNLLLDYSQQIMIQYFSQSTENRSLRELPHFKDPAKIISIKYPHNMISKIRPNITKASNTQTLDLSYNKLSVIDPAFDLVNLRLINFSHNMISVVGMGVTRLKNLESIDLGYNLLFKMENIKGLLELWKLKKGVLAIILEGNEIMKRDQDKLTAFFNSNKGQEKEEPSKALDFSMILPVSASQLPMEDKNHTKKFESSKLLLDSSSFLNCKQDTEKKSIAPKPRGIQIDKSNTSLSQLQILNQLIMKDRSSDNLANLNIETDLSGEEKKLQEINQKFDILMRSCQWEERLSTLLKDQGKNIQGYIQLHKLTIQMLRGNQIQIDLVQLDVLSNEATQYQAIIRSSHEKLIELLSQCKDTPIRSYRIWVNLYRDLRKVTDSISKKALAILLLSNRKKELEDLKFLSPNKIESGKENVIGEGKERQDLEKLLFSNKKPSQFSDDQSKEGKEQEEEKQCDECFLKGITISEYEKEVTAIKSENEELRNEVKQLRQYKDLMGKRYQCLDQNISQRQALIVDNIDRKIDATVYQAVLLEQAKGIEDLLKCPAPGCQNTYSPTMAATTGRFRGLQSDLGNVTEFDPMTSRGQRNRSSNGKKVSYFAHQIQEQERSSQRIKTSSSEANSTSRKNVNHSKQGRTRTTTAEGRTTTAEGKNKTTTNRKSGETTSTEKVIVSAKFGCYGAIAEQEDAGNDLIVVSDFVTSTEQGSKQLEARESLKIENKEQHKRSIDSMNRQSYEPSNKSNQKNRNRNTPSYRKDSPPPTQMRQKGQQYSAALASKLKHQPSNLKSQSKYQITKEGIAVVEASSKYLIPAARPDNHEKKLGISSNVLRDEASTYIPIPYKSTNLKDEEPYTNYMRFHLRNSIVQTLANKADGRHGYQKGKKGNLSKTFRQMSTSYEKISGKNTCRGRSTDKGSVNKSASEQKYIRV